LYSSYFLSLTSCGSSDEISKDDLDRQATEITESIFANLTEEAPTPEIPPGITPDTTILFSDDFSGPSSKYGYTDEGAEINQSDGGLSINVTDLNIMYFSIIPGYEYEDVIISVDVLSTEGDPEDAYGGFLHIPSSKQIDQTRCEKGRPMGRPFCYYCFWITLLWAFTIWLQHLCIPGPAGFFTLFRAQILPAGWFLILSRYFRDGQSYFRNGQS